jgi:hypothetical protein
MSSAPRLVACTDAAGVQRRPASQQVERVGDALVEAGRGRGALRGRWRSSCGCTGRATPGLASASGSGCVERGQRVVSAVACTWSARSCTASKPTRRSSGSMSRQHLAGGADLAARSRSRERSSTAWL